MLRLTKKILGFAVFALGVPLASPALALVIHQCPTNITFHEVRTEIVASTTSSTTFQLLPGATTDFGVGNQACIRVLFTAETRCTVSPANDRCDIRAVINGVEMHPRSGGTRTMDSEHNMRRAHAYEWVEELGEGNYAVRIERRVQDPATVFEIDDWTLVVMKYE